MGKEYEEIKAEISVRISTEDIDDIVTTALEGGICYWCRRVEVKGKYLGEFASEQISRGGVLVLHDSVDGKKRELNKEKLLSGVKQYLEDEDKPGGGGYVPGISLGYISQNRTAYRGAGTDGADRVQNGTVQGKTPGVPDVGTD